MSNANSRQSAVRILRLRQVQDRIGLSRSTIYDRLNQASPRYDSSFPKPFSLGGSAVGWLESEVNYWIHDRISKSNEGEACGENSL
ncbi:helix-turn-helix transcriptional regulator [Pseudomonas aeruginosa]|uniref:helix-turn-helix transcriptional regulator n=1 Tax=Pseudomonas aeruginosa TaxID=287 RepID=UPI0009A3DF2E|nr:AlpA family transcriptional regulator [Pseudomonas aeruginosa]HCH7783180.1 AlpA family transcriptional regulator [Pseudomonas aeruginosa]HEP9282163.1 AlpA family transcriptional regulator [Pseudomonas aeruginosa]